MPMVEGLGKGIVRTPSKTLSTQSATMAAGSLEVSASCQSPSQQPFGAPEKTRFLGKHSKDQLLSLYIQKRNILEWEEPTSQIEPISGILRIRPSLAERLEERGLVVILGVFSRLVCDFGLQLNEHVIYQQEAQIYPKLQQPIISDDIHDKDFKSNSIASGVVFDFETRFVTALPDQYHVPFILTLPTGLPPSITLVANPSYSNSSEFWGLTYYIFAYVTNASSVASAIGRNLAGSSWHKLRLGRRQSKVFLSISKVTIPSVSKLASEPPPTGGNTRGGLISRNPLSLQASLDRAIYQYGDTIGISLQIANPRKTHISGIRVTVKQLITVRIGHDQKTTIKVNLGRHNFDKISALLKEQKFVNERIEIRPVTDGHKFPYQLALESRYPRTAMLTAPYAPSLAYDRPQGISFFGIEKIRLLSIEYYLNVHVVIPFGPNLIVKLPFKLVTSAGGFDISALAGNFGTGVQGDLDSHFSSGILSRGSNLTNGPLFQSPSNAELAKMSNVDRRASAMAALRELAPPLITGDLIAFADDEDDDDQLNLFERPTQDANLLKQPKDHLKEPTVFTLSASEKAIEPVGSFKTDINQARIMLNILRSKVTEEQRIILCVGGSDLYTLQIHFEKRRAKLCAKFIYSLEEAIDKWIPKFEQQALQHCRTMSNSIAIEFDPINATVDNKEIDAEKKLDTSLPKPSCPQRLYIEGRELVRGLVETIGIIGTQLAQYAGTVPRQEDKMEKLNSVIDIVELLLARTQRALDGKLGEDGSKIGPREIRELIERLRQSVISLIVLLPGYENIYKALFEFAKVVRRKKDWITGTIKDPYSVCDSDNVDDIDIIDNANDEIHGGNQKSDNEHLINSFKATNLGTRQTLSAELAESFQSISMLFLDTDGTNNSRMDGLGEPFTENVQILNNQFVRSIERYIELLGKFFLSQAPDEDSELEGLAVFWQWQFLISIIDAYYAQGAASTLVMRGMRGDLYTPQNSMVTGSLWTWNRMIVRQIPSSWTVFCTNVIANTTLARICSEQGNNPEGAANNILESRITTVGNQVITLMQMVFEEV